MNLPATFFVSLYGNHFGTPVDDNLHLASREECSRGLHTLLLELELKSKENIDVDINAVIDWNCDAIFELMRIFLLLKDSGRSPKSEEHVVPPEDFPTKDVHAGYPTTVAPKVCLVKRDKDEVSSLTEENYFRTNSRNNVVLRSTLTIRTNSMQTLGNQYEKLEATDRMAIAKPEIRWEPLGLGIGRDEQSKSIAVSKPENPRPSSQPLSNHWQRWPRLTARSTPIFISETLALAASPRGQARFRFSWLLLEFHDQNIQRRFLQHIATQANMWSSLFGVILPTMALNGFYLIGDVALVVREGGRSTTDSEIRCAVAIFVFLFQAIPAVLYTRDMALMRSMSSTNSIGLVETSYDDLMLDSVEAEDHFGIGGGVSAGEECRDAADEKQQDFELLVQKTLRHSFFFAIAVHVMLSYALISRTSFNSCSFSPVPDSLCVLSIPGHSFLMILFMPIVIKLVVPLTWRGATATILISFSTTIVTCAMGHRNFLTKQPLLRAFLNDPAAFRLGLNNILPALVASYVACVICVWGIRLHSVIAFKRNEITTTCAVEREQLFFKKNGLFMLS